MSELSSPAPGMKVLTQCTPENTSGMLISQQFLDNRKNGVIGTIYGYVPGHGGDVWYVVHEGTPTVKINGKEEWDRSGIAVYTVFEMIEAKVPF